MKNKKTKILIVLEDELLQDAFTLARKQDIRISAYISSLINLAISKDLEENPILALPQIEIDILVYYRDNAHKFPGLPGYRTLQNHLIDYSPASLNTHRRKLIEKGYINEKTLLQKAITFLDERGL